MHQVLQLPPEERQALISKSAGISLFENGELIDVAGAARAAAALPAVYRSKIKLDTTVTGYNVRDDGTKAEILKYEEIAQELDISIHDALTADRQSRLDWALDEIAAHRDFWDAVAHGHKTRRISIHALDITTLNAGELRERAIMHARQASSQREILMRLIAKNEELQVEWAKKTCHRWWLRRLKKLQTTTEAHLAWIFGQTGEHRLWASWTAVENRSTDLAWQDRWLEGHFMQRREDGLILPLKQLHTDTIKAKFSEDYAIAIGMQQLAESRGLHFVMATITNPGEWSPKTGKRTTVYNGCSPVEANKELKHRLKLIRTALLAELDVCIGFAVTEPQKTGSPHLHLLLLTNDPSRVKEVILGRIVDGKRIGGYKVTDDHQIDVRDWNDFRPDPTSTKTVEEQKSSIAAYVMKYLMKGHQPAPTDSDGNMLPEDSPVFKKWRDEQLAYGAWRNGCAARTTSWFGLGRGFKGRWRAVYRSDSTVEENRPRLAARKAHLEEIPDNHLEDTRFRMAKGHMENRRWGEALAIVAGIHETISLDAADQVNCTVTSYGEIKKIRTGYILSSDEELPLRSGHWAIKELKESEENQDVEDKIDNSAPESQLNAAALNVSYSRAPAAPSAGAGAPPPVGGLRPAPASFANKNDDWELPDGFTIVFPGDRTVPVGDARPITV